MRDSQTVAIRILVVPISFVVAAFAAGIIRFFAASTRFSSISELAWQYLPWMLLGGVLAAILAYKKPQAVATAFCFIPGCDIS